MRESHETETAGLCPRCGRPQDLIETQPGHRLVACRTCQYEITRFIVEQRSAPPEQAIDPDDDRD